MNIGFYDAIPSDISQRVVAAGGELVKVSLSLKLAVAQNKTANQSDFIEALRAYADTEYVFPDLRLGLAATPNDPQYNHQWGLSHVGAPAVWDTSYGSHAVRIAVIDVGVQCTHPDLYSNCDPLSPGAMDGGCMHGTKVAGVAAAVTNNNLGVAGVSQSFIYAVNAGPPAYDGGPICYVLESEAAIFISLLANMDQRQIISMSFGTPLCAPENFIDSCTVLRHAVADADGNAKVLLVAAVGNDNGASGCNTTPEYPASDQRVIGVGGITRQDTRYARSNCGLLGKDLVAPAVDIWTTCFELNPLDHSPANANYCSDSGTSFATPFVSGGLALLWSICDTLSKADLKTVLLNNAQSLGLSTDEQGKGLLQLDWALDDARLNYGC